VLGYPDWSSYVDKEFKELPKQWRYAWRAYGQVNEVLGTLNVPAVGVDRAKVIRPRLSELKERIMERSGCYAP